MTDNNHQGNTLVPEPLLTSGEVSTLLRVDPKTVGRWVLEGKLASIRTPGGHHRFREAEIRAILNGGQS